MSEVIIMPGIGGSGDSHWQTFWEKADGRMRRFQPRSWDEPDLADWIDALEREIARCARPPLLVAHSLACLLVTHWAARGTAKIAGAFLVAVPDSSSPSFPAEAAGFAEPPIARFTFPSMIVASSDDPYGSLDHAYRRAGEWGSAVTEIGARGHVNAASGIGDWPEGKALLGDFERGIAEASFPAQP
ncbi:alpha/beta fold hydrolase [Rhizobium sp. BK251]|uniref:RBBP9/YdeN family alpha/beta hydrolase n=1 Tax=Rhizobium sp. BK251 TaxID=2512125 RepID=UPI001050A2D2|nr:alpha/beta fold hydrolase [Rhizobium sp. BK251]TCL71907.1 hypothetical protein EV286_105164 [Rhizobium sp. BK251]